MPVPEDPEQKPEKPLPKVQKQQPSIRIKIIPLLLPEDQNPLSDNLNKDPQQPFTPPEAPPPFELNCQPNPNESGITIKDLKLKIKSSLKF